MPLTSFNSRRKEGRPCTVLLILIDVKTTLLGSDGNDATLPPSGEFGDWPLSLEGPVALNLL
jgi:hypothetical protein